MQFSSIASCIFHSHLYSCIMGAACRIISSRQQCKQASNKRQNRQPTHSNQQTNKQTASKQQIYNKQSTETNILNGQRRSRLARFLPAFLQRVFFIAKRPFFYSRILFENLVFFRRALLKALFFQWMFCRFLPYYGIFWGIVPIINGTMNFRY